MHTANKVAQKYAPPPGKMVNLTYRGQHLNPAAKMYHYAPASAALLRFSAKFVDPSEVCMTSARTEAQIAESYEILVKTLTGKTIFIKISASEYIVRLKAGLGRHTPRPAEIDLPRLSAVRQ